MTTSTEDAAPKEEAAATERSTREVDLRRWGRAASTVLGGAMLVGGLRRRSIVGLASAAAGGALLYRGISGRNPLQRAGRDAESEVYRRDAANADSPATVERTVTVRKPPEELAEYWRDPEQLSRLLGEFAEVSDGGGNRLRWEVDGPLGRTVAWQTRIASDRPGEEIRWDSVDDSVLANEWTVSFDETPDGEETEVTLSVRVDPPGGAAGRAVAGRLLPASLLGAVLDRFESLAETGEIPTLETNPSGRGRGDRM